MTAIESDLTGPQFVTRLGFQHRIARTFLVNQLRQLTHGTMVLEEGDLGTVFGQDPEPWGVIRVLQPSFYPAVLLGGSIGAAESYMEGGWDSPDLTSVIAVMSRNLAVSDKVEAGLARLLQPLLKLGHLARRNTRSGSRRNIAEHYDLSNDFFSRFLDPSMMYSSAVFPHANATLEQASHHKLDRVCSKLKLGPGDHVLEIGTGWGSMAIWAARNYGCRVTTTTISQAQYDYAAARIEEAGLSGRIELLLEDYRDLKGSYDKLISIEMIEAVGHHYLGQFMGKCSALLKPDGAMLLQAITMPDHRYQQALREVDFIKRFIFPGSFIPSIGAICSALAERGDLCLVHVEDQTPHYAETLKHWRHNFESQRNQGDIGNKSESFRRMWRYYFCYCEGAFRERVIGSTQILLKKPFNRAEPLLHPLTTAAVGSVL